MLAFCLSLEAKAKPIRRGFYEGPYLTLSGGVLQFDWDINQRTKVEEGHSFEPLLVLGFGWNINDWIAPEMQLRYSTNFNGGRREHIAAINLGGAFTWIAKPLTDFRLWHILPFIKPSFTVQVSSLPGDPLAADHRVTIVGVGPNIGGGIRFLFKDYLYLGIEVQDELLQQSNKSQTLNPGGSNLIYAGGWKQQFLALGMVGIHF